ncbi:MAG: hypothetical protein ACK51T_06630, partial [bacterium]
MSSLREGIDTTHVGEKKPGGGGAGPSGEGKANGKKLAFAVVVLLGGVGLIVWQLTSGVKPGTAIPSSPTAGNNVVGGTSAASTGPAAPAQAAPDAVRDHLVRGRPRDMPS